MLLTFGDHGYDLRAGESVLECLARHGVELPSTCRAGTCHSCLLRAERGDPGEAGRGGLKPTLRARGYFLACLARPVTDLTVAPPASDVVTPATLVRSERPASHVLVIWLRPLRPLGFRAGQQVTLSRDGVIRPYSIANLPTEVPRDGLEFHVRVYPGGAMSGWLAGAAPGARLGLGVPTGECFYLPGRAAAPLLLAGTGTGIAPLAAIARDALAAGHRGPVTVLQGAAEPGGLYLAEGPVRSRVPDGGAARIRWRTCVLSRGQDIAEEVSLELARLGDPAIVRAYLCGGVRSVARMRRALFMAGMSLQSIQADEFVPAATSG